MTEVLLKKISLKNYMGAENVEIDFSEKTEIRGKNRCGKSTLMNAYFEMIIHDMPLADAQQYLRELHSFYSAGWLKIMGQ